MIGYFLLSVSLTFLTVFVLDAYMNRGEILDFIRIAAAQWIAERNGLDFDTKELDDFENYDSPQYFERMAAYDVKYWEIAFHSKLMNPFICKSCMSFYIGLFYSVGFIYFLQLDFPFSVAWVFVQNLIVFFLIELKTKNNE